MLLPERKQAIYNPTYFPNPLNVAKSDLNSEDCPKKVQSNKTLSVMELPDQKLQKTCSIVYGDCIVKQRNKNVRET